MDQVLYMVDAFLGIHGGNQQDICRETFPRGCHRWNRGWNLARSGNGIPYQSGNQETGTIDKTYGI